MADASSRMQPVLRADARHNRDRILEAARGLFATRGLDVPMAAVARRAGVGVATLYRRFPTRESLVTTVFADQLTACTGTIDEALADPDPWAGFSGVVEKICAMNILDRGFAAAFLTAFPDAAEFEETRVRAEKGFAELARRAKDAGRLRADFDRSDLTLVLMANNGINARSTQAALAASRRLVALLLHSFRADSAALAADPLPPPAPLDPYHLPWPGATTA
ncbi:TetR/AcrR family transcriptional regulator [Streptomyces sp. NPDC017230]|uniref:TetR/AcrR family transcriptional regulator n=1 Tax=unclassified Streptomyces TaxID=2593676 RepID=UPI0037BB7E6A